MQVRAEISCGSRDRGILIRRVLLLLVALIAGAFVYGQWIGQRTVGCLAQTLGGASDATDKTVE